MSSVPQCHRPGEALQTDFTWAQELGVTIAGVPFSHLLCHVVLPCSNWEWVTVCRSESLAALKRGLQEAVFRLGRLPEFTEEEVRVSAWSTIYVKRNVYSVPSRLIREKVRVRVYGDRLEVYYGGQRQFSLERLLGRGGHRINYRHIIWSLVRKPGAFRLYKYQDDLYPSRVLRQAYDKLSAVYAEDRANREYIRILHLAASTLESEVAAALELLLENGSLTGIDQVKALVDSPAAPPPALALRVPAVDLTIYDSLLPAGKQVA